MWCVEIACLVHANKVVAVVGATASTTGMRCVPSVRLTRPFCSSSFCLGYCCVLSAMILPACCCLGLPRLACLRLPVCCVDTPPPLLLSVCISAACNIKESAGCLPATLSWDRATTGLLLLNRSFRDGEKKGGRGGGGRISNGGVEHSACGEFVGFPAVVVVVVCCL